MLEWRNKCSSGLVWLKVSAICAIPASNAKYQCVPPKEPMKSLRIPNLPCQIVSHALFKLDQKSYLVTVCHFSDWIEVDALPDTLSATVINARKAHFARYGIPRICHTDNGPQFISKEYQAFASSSLQTYKIISLSSSGEWLSRSGSESCKKHV